MFHFEFSKNGRKYDIIDDNNGQVSDDIVYLIVMQTGQEWTGPIRLDQTVQNVTDFGVRCIIILFHFF